MDIMRINEKIIYIKFLNFFDKIIFCLMKAGPITALNKVPGKDPIEKQAKKIPARDLSNI